MAVFTFIPASADEIVYVSVGDINPIQFVGTPSIRLGADNAANFNTTDVLYFLTSDISGIRNNYVTAGQVPYNLTSFVLNQDVSALPFYISQYLNSNIPGLRMVFSIDLGFNYYFTNFTYDFYVLVPIPYTDSASSYSFNIYYIDDESNINSFSNVTTTVVKDNVTVQNLATLYPSILSDYYNNVYNKYKYWQINQTSNSSFASSLIKVSINENFGDYESIRSLGFSITYTFSGTGGQAGGKRLGFNIHLPDTLSGAYIKTSATQEYIRMLTEVNEKLDVVTGSPSQQQQAAIDQVDYQLATEYDELQEQLDIIHSPEMPTELPTEDFSNLEDEATVINNYLGDLNLLNIFNIIVPAGCAGFLIYIVLRRF